jgi:hypothetical protein
LTREGFANDVVDVQPVCARRCLLDERADEPGDFARSLPSSMIRLRDSRALSRSGGCAASQRKPALVLLTTAVIGWFTSLAVEAVNANSVRERPVTQRQVSRFAFA